MTRTREKAAEGGPVMRRLHKWTGVALFAAAIMAAVVTPRAQTSTGTGTTGVDTTLTPPAATPPATPPPPPPATPGTTKPPLRERIYYGGSVVFSFGSDMSRIGVFPMIAYKVRPKLSVGLEAGYEHVSWDDFDQSADNYGGSVFSRYRLLPQMYLHAEYQMVNYEIFTGLNTSERDWVPFLLLGGGISRKVGGRSWAYVEVLVDVLQSDDSPYEDWEPVMSVGVGVGF
jgi:hypothetical protein